MSESDQAAIKIAKRYHEYKGLTLPVDVETLLREKTDVIFLPMPFPLDGLCVDLKVIGRRPRVFVNTKPSKLRQRFTMAHELGHVVIPWHIGTISDTIDLDADGSYAHRAIEAEANAFASELLMPNNYVLQIVAGETSLERMIVAITDDCQVSIAAALFRVADSLPKNYFVICDDGFSGKLIEMRSPRTQFSIGRFSSVDQAKVADLQNGQLEDFQLRSYKFVCWRFPVSLEVPPIGDSDDWRSLLTWVVAQECPDSAEQHRLKQSMNAIVSNINSFGRKCFNIDTLYAEAINRFSADNRYKMFSTYPEFRKYITLRLQELMRRREERGG